MVTLQRQADFVAHRDLDGAAGGLQHGPVGRPQHRAVEQMRSLQIAWHIRHQDLAAGLIYGKEVLAHGPFDFRIQAAIGQRQPANGGWVVAQRTLGGLDDHIMGAGACCAAHMRAGRQRHIAVFSRQTDRAASGRDIGAQGDKAALPAGIKGDSAGGRCYALPACGGDD